MGKSSLNIKQKHKLINADLSVNLLKRNKYRNVQCDLNMLPFKNNAFDITLCVGSVLNYCDAAKTIKNISKVTKKGGLLILECEVTNSFEHIFSRNYNKNIALIETFHGDDKKHLIWNYSENYLNKMLNQYSFVIKIVERFHILSALMLAFNLSPKISSKFCILDNILKKIPYVRKHPSNMILLAEKV